MSQESRFGAHIGTSSLLLIFLTLSLVSFGALSLAGAKADQRLSQKLYEHTLSYYSACHDAERFVAQTDHVLRQAYKNSEDEETYRSSIAGLNTEETFPVGDSQELVVRLAFLYPEDFSGTESPKLYSVRSWCVKSISDDSFTRHLPVSGSGELDG